MVTPRDIAQGARAFITGTPLSQIQQQARAAEMQEQQNFLNLDRSRQQALFDDARVVNSLLNSGQQGRALDVLGQRAELLGQIGGNPSDTLEIAQLIQSGNIQGAKDLLTAVEDAGIAGGFLKDLNSAAKGKEFAPSPVEKNFARLTGLRQQLSSAQNSGDQNAIDAAEIQLNDFMNLSGLSDPSAQERSDIRVTEAANKELSKQAAVASKDAFDGLKNVRSSIGNMTDAIRALDKGAATGPIISRLPSFRDASIELDNIRGKMGLDVVGATTFGALSESELGFALDVALPNNLEPKALKEWITKKRDAQKKLGKELMRAATFLGKPGNTISKYIEQETNSGRLSFDGPQETDVTKLSDDELFN